MPERRCQKVNSVDSVWNQISIPFLFLPQSILPAKSPSRTRAPPMAPFNIPTSSRLFSLLAGRADAAAAAATDEPTTVSGFLETQWRNPSDILPVLMLLGPDIVQKAIAQVSRRTIAPVAFSFG